MRRVNLPEGMIASSMMEKGILRERRGAALAHCLPGARLRVNNVTVTPGFVLARATPVVLRKTAFARRSRSHKGADRPIQLPD